MARRSQARGQGGRGEEANMKRAKEKLEIHVGDSLEETGHRFIEAWHGERHLSFKSLEGLLSLLTLKRWQLLKFVHRNPVPSIRALSVELRRDYRRVHDDVEALARAGLLQREGRAVRADYNVIESSFRFD
jgi:predicted transcriptional regulator